MVPEAFARWPVFQSEFPTQMAGDYCIKHGQLASPYSLPASGSARCLRLTLREIQLGQVVK